MGDAAEKQPTTWEIAESMRNAFDPETGEVDEQRWADLGLALEMKAESIHSVLWAMDGDEAGIVSEIERLKKRITRLRSRRDHLREYMRACLEHAGLDRIRTARVTMKRQPGRERVIIDDVDALPPTYVRETVTREGDKRAIGDAIKGGQTIQGAHVERGPETLYIR